MQKEERERGRECVGPVCVRVCGARVCERVCESERKKEIEKEDRKKVKQENAPMTAMHYDKSLPIFLLEEAVA